MKYTSSYISRCGAMALCAALVFDGASFPAALAQSRPEATPSGAPKGPPAPSAAASAGGDEEPLVKESLDLLGSEDSVDTLVARNQFIKGVNLARQEQWADAYPALTDAWKHKKHWQIALNLGRVEFEIGRYRDAAEHFELVLRAPALARPPNDTPDPLANDRSLATVWLAKARSKLGYIRVNASPGAQVFLDGNTAGEAPLPTRLGADPGKHTIEVRSGRTVRREDVELKSGDEVTLTLKVNPAPSNTTTVAAPAPETPAVAPSPARPMLVMGAGVAVTLTGLVLGGVALSLASEYGQMAFRDKQGPSGSHASAEAYNKNVALWSFFGAGIAGFAGFTYYLVTSASSSPVHVTPVAGPVGGGALLHGRF